MSAPPFHQWLPRPTAFVLGGGASLGAVQVGQARAAFEAGLVPDRFVGTSAGAINAAFLASGWSMERIERLTELWVTLRGEAVFGDPTALRLLLAAARRRPVSDGGGLRAILAEIEDDRARLAIPAAVVATDLLAGSPVVLDRGALRAAVYASAAVPGLLPPIRVDGRLLADGGLVAQVPIRQALDGGARSLVVFDTGYPCAIPGPPDSVVGWVLHVLGLMVRRQTEPLLALLPRDIPVLYLPAPCPVAVPFHDFTHARELIDQGYAGARAFFEDLAGAAPFGGGVHGHPHLHGEVGAHSRAPA